jgi:hypothetical protein
MKLRTLLQMVVIILAGTNIGSAAFVAPAGLAFWVRADRGVTLSGNDVTAWADQSGNNFHLATAGTFDDPTLVTNVQTGMDSVGNPIFNSVVRFDGNDLMNNGVAGTHSAQTIFMVTRFNGGGVPYTRHGGTNEYFGTVSDGNLYLKNPQTYWIGGETTLVGGGFHVLSGLYQDPANGSNGSIYDNGILQATGTGGSSPANLYDEIGARWSTDSYNAPFSGDIAELLVFSTNLNAADRESVENYLTEKYLFTEAGPAPEPSTFLLLGFGTLVIVSNVRRRRATAADPASSIE